MFISILILLIFLFLFANFENNGKEISYNEFLFSMKNNKIKEIIIYNKYIQIITFENVKKYVNTNGNKSLESEVVNFWAKYCNENPDAIILRRGKNNLVKEFLNRNLTLIFSILIVLFGLGSVLGFLEQNIRKRTDYSERIEKIEDLEKTSKNDRFNINKINKKININNNVIKFKDIGGCEEAKESLYEVIEYLKDPKKFKKNGSKIHKGILLYGPPGNGKTLLAKAIAGESGCNFISVSASEFDEVFVGLGASKIRNLFDTARANSPIIIFIDEIDAMGNRDDNMYISSKQTINQLLTEMDGFTPSDDVIIIAATNDYSKLDEALLRSGRFDKKILVSFPENHERLEILNIHLQNKRIDSDFNIQEIADKTAGFSASDLATLINEASILANKNDRNITNEYVDIVFEKLSKTITAIYNTGVSLEDVGGLPEAKRELEEIVGFLKDNDKFKKIGATLPKGAALYGPPGTGKTLLAKAVAGDAECAFLYASASEFDDTFVGVGAKKVRELFARAKNYKKCLIFIDEIDALGRRDKKEGSTSHQTINQLLTEIDGFKALGNVFVMVATNDISQVDPALIRSGRFDRKIYIGVPSVKERIGIIETLVRKRKIQVDENFDPKYMASITQGYAGADISTLLNEAAMHAVRSLRDKVNMQDIFEAKDKLAMGSTNESIKMKEKERNITAYHEAGHALLGYYFCRDILTIHKATIVPRGNSLGLVSYFNNEEKYSISKEDYKNRIKMMLAGRAAEEILGGSVDKISSGASSDLERATEIAKKMIAECGLGDDLAVFKNNISPQLSEKIELAVEKLLKELYQETIVFLKQHSKEHNILVKALLDKETLSLDEIHELFSMKN